ncbi:hypothetical protein ES703_68095 [subsurface metagenome]
MVAVLEELFGSFQVRFFREANYGMDIAIIIPVELDIAETGSGPCGLDAEGDEVGSLDGLLPCLGEGPVELFLLTDQVIRRKDPHDTISKALAEDKGCQGDSRGGIPAAGFYKKVIFRHVRNFGLDLWGESAGGHYIETFTAGILFQPVGGLDNK